jgi:Outer membrane protein beta-barrel domain
MLRFYFNICFLLSFLPIFSQEKIDFDAIDSLYREDQFYINFTYNIIRGQSSGISQNSLSSGVNVGFLRDFPINKNRTFAIAPGIGFSFNNYKQNLIIDDLDNKIGYNLTKDSESYDRNKLAMYFVDLPIEFRWRTSTFESHKFWRIYAGLKMSYLLYSFSNYSSSNRSFSIDNNPDINKLQYGVYLSSGYNSGNFYVYYGLNNMFKNGSLEGSTLQMRTLNLGLMFYIL